MAQASKTPTSDDPIRSVIRKTVADNKPLAVDSIVKRFTKSGVPHIKMGQLRKLMSENYGKLEQELSAARDALAKAQAGSKDALANAQAAAKDALAKAQAAAQAQLDRERSEFEKRLELEREKAKEAGERAGAKRELDAAQVRIAELMESMNKQRNEWDAQKALLESENLKLKNIVASMDLSKHEQFLKRIKELEEQLQAARDALAAANAEIQRLLGELRYAEPTIAPDHESLSRVVDSVDRKAAKMAVDASRTISHAINFVRFNEERCQAELPKLVERMNNLGASFPQVVRMIKLTTMHDENRRWMAVLDGVLTGG